MRLIEAEQKLLTLNQPILKTNDVSACLQIPDAQASKLLERLSKAKRFVRIMRGKWATTQKIDPLILPEYLTAPFPSYISLQTALYYHGMISQIPSKIYAISLSRTKEYKTGFGDFSIHHVQPDFFFGFEMVGAVKLATPEKALIDVFYLTSARSKLFKVLPEVELPKAFSMKQVERIIDKIKVPRLRTMVRSRLEEIIG